MRSIRLLPGTAKNMSLRHCRTAKKKQDQRRTGTLQASSGTVTAVERADVVVMVIDAVEGITEQDAKIAGIAHDRGKGIVIVVNKWMQSEKNE